jgi:hypothetical protein
MELLPGDVGLSTIGGRVGTLVTIGQAVIGDGCRYTHARIVLGTFGTGSVTYLEAIPSGARVVSTADPASAGVWYRLPLTDEQLAAVPVKGYKLPGTRYGFSDYLALALHHLAPRSRLTAGIRRYVSGNGRMICSQLVDHLLCEAGYHLFDDGRLPQDVTPGDLFYALTEQGTRVL